MTKSVFVLGFLFSIWGRPVLAETVVVKNGFAESNGDSKSIEVSVLDADKAIALFKKILVDTQIPFDDVKGRCYQRATALAHWAETQGIQMGKVFIEGTLSVHVSGLAPIHFTWHVAPFIFVRSENGSIDTLVFDPTYFRAPVSITGWETKFSGGKQIAGGTY